MANTTVLNEKGSGLCGICRKKFFISDLKMCSSCDKWVCREHTIRYKGLELCARCYSELKNSK